MKDNEPSFYFGKNHLEFEVKIYKKGRKKNIIKENIIYIGNINNYKKEKLEETIGTTLLEILNNYTVIKELFENYMRILEHIEFYLKIPEYTILSNSNIFTLDSLMQDFISDILKLPGIKKSATFFIANEIDNLINVKWKEMDDLKKLYVPDFNDYFENHRICALEFVKKYILRLEELVNMSNKVFTKYEKDIDNNYVFTYKYTGNFIELPNSKVFFDGIDKSTIVKYNYTISTLEELFAITIYHIEENNYVLTKCQNCKDFFIPNRNNEIYCNKNLGKNSAGETITCKKKGKNSKNTYNDAGIRTYYHNLYMKMKKYNSKHNIKEINELIKKLQKEYKSFRRNDRKFINDKNKKEFKKFLDTTDESYKKLK